GDLRSDALLHRGAFDRQYLLACQLVKLINATVSLDHHLLTGDEGREREVDQCLTLLAMGQGGGQEVDTALLQLGYACCVRQLLHHRLDTDARGDGSAKIHVVTHDFASCRVLHEAERLVGAEHATDQLPLCLDIAE